MPQQYVYRSQKVAGQVRRYYVGTVDSAEAEDYRQEVERRRRQRDQLKNEERLLDELESLDVDLQELEASAMAERGYEQTESRKWRKQQQQ